MLSSNGGQAPHDPSQRALPPDPPLPTPVGFGFAGVLGPTRGGVANVGKSLPLLSLWGDTPHDPPPWGLRPLDPLLLTPVGLGFASVLGPTRGRVANVGNSLPLLSLWGDTPHDPSQRALPPDPPLPTLVGLGLARVLGPTRWRGC
jgi:hypothetical protein